MRTLMVLGLLLVAAGCGAATAPSAPALGLTARVIHEGESVTATGTGFTPGGNILAHLARPDGTEYPEMSLVADDRGAVSHLIRIILIQVGTYELQLIDLKTNAIAVTRFMVVEGTLPAPPGSNAGRTPASFAGVWQGEMAYPQAQPAGRQMVMVALSGGAVGAVVGSVAYPSLACGGELWLMGVAGDSVQLGEHITYGENACASHGVVTARVAPNGALDVQRIVAEDPKAPPATGMLPRRL